MVLKILAGFVLVTGGAALLVGCATDEAKPQLPTSEHSDMPWNTPRPGEGGGAFGGVFDR
ncbi:MAG: hypothetical protein HKN82_17000 [Akkermansiaceae bacterium]|nr:hypothetical protein [Akkermansiaceae bacterium]